MTPPFALLIGVGFTGVLLLGAVVLEQTEVGRRFAERAIAWIVR